MTAVAGVVLALAWWALLRYYRRLNSAKFDVINQLEERLPATPFRDEWKILHPNEPVSEKAEAKLSPWSILRLRTKHREATVIEQVVPFAFVAIYLTLALRVICQ